MMLLIFYNVGSTANSLIFYLLSWRMAIIFYFIIPLVLIITGLVLYAKDPPLDLIAFFNSE
jgi:Ni,Fe-hydrogenase I cytochrome b subunit